MARKYLFLVIFLAGILVAGCSGAPAPVEYTIEMTEFAFSPDTIELKVGQEVTLHIVNEGALAHEFMIGQEPMQNADGQFVMYEHDLFEGVTPVVTKEGDDHGDEAADTHSDEAGSTHNEESDDAHADAADDTHADEGEHMEGMDHGFMVTLAGNDSHSVTTISFTVTEDMTGEWEMGCFLDGGSHYTSGMTGKVVVTP